MLPSADTVRNGVAPLTLPCPFTACAAHTLRSVYAFKDIGGSPPMAAKCFPALTLPGRAPRCSRRPTLSSAAPCSQRGQLRRH